MRRGVTNGTSIEANGAVRIESLLASLPDTEPGISSVDLAKMHGHRFQATVKQCRDMGYQIQGRLIGGVKHYWIEGFEARMAVTPQMQEAYYQSAHWLQLRERRLDYDNWTCGHCRRIEPEMHCHHWEYCLFAEELWQLQTLCSNCHNYIHECISRSSVKFPAYVAPEIGEKLTALVKECLQSGIEN